MSMSLQELSITIADAKLKEEIMAKLHEKKEWRKIKIP